MPQCASEVGAHAECKKDVRHPFVPGCWRDVQKID